MKNVFNDKKGNVYEWLGIEQGKDINLSTLLGNLGINSQTVTDLTNKFKDNADQLLQSMKTGTSELRELLENAGIDAKEINEVVSKFEQNNIGAGGTKASLAFGLIVASFVIFQMYWVIFSGGNQLLCLMYIQSINHNI